MFFGVKKMVGISCVEMLLFGIDLMEKFDEFVHRHTGVHLFHYPDFIINMCYRCTAMGDTQEFSKTSQKIFNDVFVMLPNNIFGPIGSIIRGILTIFGFFDL
jgi:hypothetical protein